GTSSRPTPICCPTWSTSLSADCWRGSWSGASGATVAGHDPIPPDAARTTPDLRPGDSASRLHAAKDQWRCLERPVGDVDRPLQVPQRHVDPLGAVGVEGEQWL